MDGLAQHLVNKTHSTNASRIIVGIAGIPASGKSTFALTLTANINTLLQSSHVAAIMVPLDGWHLTRAQLDAFPDPKLAHDRRGIHWTFDGLSYLSFLHSLRADPDASTILTAPSFDHALKDPSPDAVAIHPYHRIVIIEGLYTFLDVEPWGEAGRMLDERWWVACDEGEARRRLVKRHVVTGVAENWDEAEKRADENDMPNEILNRAVYPPMEFQNIGRVTSALSCPVSRIDSPSSQCDSPFDRFDSKQLYKSTNF